MRITIIIYLIIFICIFSILNNCQYAVGHRESDKQYVADDTLIETYDVIEVSDYSFTIEWDAPVGATPNAYRIYYKEHSAIYWTLLDEIPYNQLEYEINYNDLDGKELYEFGISAVYFDEESLLHSSLDSEAIPSSGWYIKWIIH